MLPYDDLLSDLNGLYEGERDPIANAANTPAAIWQHLPDINWAGFYFLKGGELVLGPFYGKLACVRIALGKGGVCGTAAAVPLIRKRRLIGVLDIDSPSLNRFADADRIGCEAVAAAYVAALDA